MIKAWTGKIRKWLGDNGDAWSKPAQPSMPVAPEPGGANCDEPVHDAPSPTRDPSIMELRDQLIGGELAEEVQAKSSDQVRIVPAGPTMPGLSEHRSFTEQGLVSSKDQFFVQTSEGRFIRGSELHGGGRCATCGGFSDKGFCCATCGVWVCTRHAIGWGSQHVCIQESRRLRFHEDTWSEPEKKQ